MRYQDFLRSVILEGIDAAEQSYAKSPAKRRGAVAGFRACVDQSPDQLRQLLRDAQISTKAALHESTEADDTEIYWEARCYEAEVEWVCNCVSAMLQNEGMPTIVTPTARGVMKAASILGVGSRAR